MSAIAINNAIQEIGILLFPDFETLDVFGPAEIFGILKNEYRVSFYSESGGMISNNHGVTVSSQSLNKISAGTDIFLIPGGYGTRELVNNAVLMKQIQTIANASTYVLTVCTGSGVLAKTGLLDNRYATSNKKAFAWASGNSKQVKWLQKARWTVDGKYYTSAGVSAGMDMVLGFLKDRHGEIYARNAANHIEYNWIDDQKFDPFADLYL